jgi:photosystem II stability/assembly factor-like uncharacterized protein
MVSRSAAGTTPWIQLRIVAAAIAAVVALLLLILARNYVREPQVQQWVQLGSPFDGTINALLVEDPNGVRVMYAGTEGGVFKSVDQGEHWVACNQGLTDRLVRSLAIDPDNPNILYAGTWSGKVFVSENAGASWERRSSSLPPYEIHGLAVNTQDPQKLLALNSLAVFVTADRGLHWRQAGEVTEPLSPDTAESTSTLQCLAMDPEQPNVLYIGTSDGVYISTDGGTTWDPSATQLNDVSAIVITARAPGGLYAIAGGKVYTTSDAATSWNYADSYRDDNLAQCIAVNPRNPQEVYVGFLGGLYKSTDGRQTWTRSDAGLQSEEGQPLDLRVLLVDPLDPSTVYASAGNQLFMSADKGQTWKFRSAIRANSEASILALVADPKSGRTFYASVDAGGLYKSSDGGERWQHVGEGLPAQHITALAVDPIDTQVVYVGYALGNQGCVARSTDSGNTLPTATNCITEADISVLAIDPEQPTRIYAGTEGRGVFRSDDGGLEWMAKPGDIGGNIRRLLVNVKESRTAVYAEDETTIYRSYNAGDGWLAWNPGFVWADIAPPAKSATQPFLVTSISAITMTAQTAIQIASEGNVALAPETITVLSQPSGASPTDLKELTIGTAMPEALYALVQGRGLFWKADPNAQWMPLGSGLESFEVQALALSPDDASLILVGTNRGICRYQPDRSPWASVQENWRHLQARAKNTLERWRSKLAELIR